MPHKFATEDENEHKKRISNPMLNYKI